jgi:hypothetical protein
MSELIASFEVNAIEAAAQVQRVRVCPDALREAVGRLVSGASSIALGAGEFIPDGLMQALRDLPGALELPTDEQLSKAGPLRASLRLGLSAWRWVHRLPH